MMTEDPITIGPEASIHEAAKVISSRKHNRLPVVEHGRLVGVVTRLDVLEALTAETEAGVLRALARVNLAAMERNVARLRRELGDGTELGAVVKADAYGHGAAPCARAALAGGASWLAVATAARGGGAARPRASRRSCW